MARPRASWRARRWCTPGTALGAARAASSGCAAGAGHLLDAYVSVSPELAALARELGDCPDDKLKVIENGIDLADFGGAAAERDAARAELGIPDDGWVVGSVGRMAREKDYPLLVRAAAPLLGPARRGCCSWATAARPRRSAPRSTRGA